jgi:hypothetical protein
MLVLPAILPIGLLSYRGEDSATVNSAIQTLVSQRWEQILLNSILTYFMVIL